MEHSILERGVYLVIINILGKTNASMERTMAGLAHVIAGSFIFPTCLSFTADGEHSIFDGKGYVFLVQTGKFGVQIVFPSFS